MPYTGYCAAILSTLHVHRFHTMRSTPGVLQVGPLDARPLGYGRAVRLSTTELSTPEAHLYPLAYLMLLGCQRPPT